MSRRRFYVPPDCIIDGSAVLPPDQIHHLRDVVRLRIGDAVEIFDGEGRGYRGKVEVCGDEVRIRSLEALAAPEQHPGALVLAPALIKSDRFEWMLQKATELGVVEFVPLVARLGSVRIPESRMEARLGRWRRIVREACKQCRRLVIPKVGMPVSVFDFLALEGPHASSRLLFDEKAVRRWDGAISLSSRVVACVGPEGGWHPAEVEAALQAGFEVFSLGFPILRAETASLAAVTLLRFQMNVGVSSGAGTTAPPGPRPSDQRQR